MRVALDTNVLVYAELEPDTDKGALAASLIRRAAASDAILAAQVVGEFLAVVRRKRREGYPAACNLVLELISLLQIADTDAAVMRRAIELTERCRIQLWDAVICAASLEAGATHLLSEDMHDGLAIGELRLLNPFADANRQLLDRLLPPLA